LKEAKVWFESCGKIKEGVDKRKLKTSLKLRLEAAGAKFELA